MTDSSHAHTTGGDEIGIGVLLFMVVCTICGYLAATLLFVPAIAYLVGGLGFGTCMGSFGTITAFIAIGALYTFVIGMVTRLLQVVLGPPALFVALALFVFLNIPSLGATYTAGVLPPFRHFLNEFWIGAETTNAERSLLYLGGSGVGTDLLRLLVWSGVVLALLLLPALRKRAPRPEHQVVTDVQPAPSQVATHH